MYIVVVRLSLDVANLFFPATAGGAVIALSDSCVGGPEGRRVQDTKTNRAPGTC